MLLLSSCGATAPCPAPPPSAPPPPPLVVAPRDDAARVPGRPFAVVRRSNYRIEFGEYAFEVDPTDGARILEFSFAGQSIVVPAAESPDAFGSSLWPSPQSDWGWPPPAELDRLPWKVVRAESELVLESQTNRKLGLSVRQRALAEPRRGSMLLEYEFTNRGTTPRKVAPWQNTRVRPGGLTFYPAQAPSYSIQYNTLLLTPENGIAWYAHDPTPVPESVKSFADGEEGWMAQLDGRLLFIKIFEDVPASSQAPGEGEVVLYVHNSGKFVEMENQGAYQELLPGASLVWKLSWVLRPLPHHIEGRRGEAALVEFARKIVAELRRHQ